MEVTCNNSSCQFHNDNKTWYEASYLCLSQEVVFWYTGWLENFGSVQRQGGNPRSIPCWLGQLQGPRGGGRGGLTFQLPVSVINNIAIRAVKANRGRFLRRYHCRFFHNLRLPFRQGLWKRWSRQKLGCFHSQSLFH